MTPPKQDGFFKLGMCIAGAMEGEDPAAINRRAAKEAVMTSPEAAPFHRELCKIAAAAFDVSGEPNSATAILFKNLSKEEVWHGSYNQFTDSVRRALAKSATSLLPAVAATHDKVGGGVFKTLLAGGALGGTALGALAFLMTRNAQQSSAENAALLEKVKAYKRLKRDIEEDMSNEGTLMGGTAAA